MATDGVNGANGHADGSLAGDDIPVYDALLVGAGFGSYTTLMRLRKQGLKCRIWEKGTAGGGIWYWNSYPGARVDSDTPIYQLWDKELYDDFTFRERYPGWKELQRYFKYLDQKLDVAKDTEFNKNVESAEFDEQRNQWLVECTDGSQAYCRWFIPCIGFAAKRYTPPIKGVSDFQGDIFHTAVWPQWGVTLKNKRVAVVGTGASGIQTIQETGPLAKHLTVYMRTPNYCLPMNQRLLDYEEEQRKKKDGVYDKEFEKCGKTFSGFTYDFEQKNTFDATPEEREKFYHKLMVEDGGFKFWLGAYKDMLFDQKANDEAYKFWRKTVQARMKNKEKAEMLAPENPPHPWGTKRPSLEQCFYEVVDKDNVDIIDVNANPIEEITEKGIRTSKGHVDVDMIIFATGFDAVTGSLSMLNIKGTDGKTIKEHWSNGTRTSMGMSMAKFPNMFFLYGPQAPTAFSNGPSCVQYQAMWLDKAIEKLEADGVKRFEPKEEAVDEWCQRCTDKWEATLFPLAKSWYSGANIPGKKVEALNWAGGMVDYRKALDDSLENNYQQWIAVK